jgi:hypothetical protein
MPFGAAGAERLAGKHPLAAAVDRTTPRHAKSARGQVENPPENTFRVLARDRVVAPGDNPTPEGY